MSLNHPSQGKRKTDWDSAKYFGAEPGKVNKEYPGIISKKNSGLVKSQGSSRSSWV